MWFFIITGFLSSCIKDEPLKPHTTVISASGKNAVYITNEGNFQFGNSSVSYYEDNLSDAVGDLFQDANQRPLGDICQSLCFFNNKAYLVVNNSGKVEIVNPNTFKSIGAITGLSSPRYFMPVSNNKAYVTDLYARTISIIDLNTLSITGNIYCTSGTDAMQLSYGKVFVTNNSSNKLFIINTAQDKLIDSIKVGFAPNSIVADKFGMLWILCNGKPGQTENASLYQIDPISNQVEKTFTFFKKTDAPWRLKINGGNDTLYFLNKDLYRMAIEDLQIPENPFIKANGRNFYGLGVNPHNNNIYVADAIDYVQRGKVYIYTALGNKDTSFYAGIIPGDFYFK